jgi:hypothetical protein
MPDSEIILVVVEIGHSCVEDNGLRHTRRTVDGSRPTLLTITECNRLLHLAYSVLSFTARLLSLTAELGIIA